MRSDIETYRTQTFAADETPEAAGGYLESLNAGQLFCRYRDHDEVQCLDELLRRTKPWLFGVILKIMCDMEAAKDVYQDAWLNLIATMHRFDPGRSKFESYIFKIASNQAFKALRYHKRMVRQPDMLENPFNEPISSQNALQTAIAKQRTQIVIDAIYSLPEKYQDVLVLHYINEKDVKTIAELLGTSENNVKTWLDRGRKRLRKKLAKYYDNDSI